MPAIKLCLLLFCLQPLIIKPTNALVEDVIDVLYLGREIIKTISASWELADQVGVTNEIDLPFMQRKEKKILSRMAEINQEFRNAEMMVQELSEKTMKELIYYIRSSTKLELVIHEMIDLVSRIENIHDQYEEYVAHYDNFERDTLESFARGVIEDNALSVKGMLPRIQRLVGGPTVNEFRVLGNHGVFQQMSNDLKARL